MERYWISTTLLTDEALKDIIVVFDLWTKQNSNSFSGGGVALPGQNAVWRLALEGEIPQNYENRINFTIYRMAFDIELICKGLSISVENVTVPTKDIIYLKWEQASNNLSMGMIIICSYM